MKKLADMIENGFGAEENHNCAERILLGANQAYNLELPPEALRMAAGMGGGLGVGALCGPVNAAVMVLGRVYATGVGLESPGMREKVKQFLETFQEREGSFECAVLRAGQKNARKRCDEMIWQVARQLDEEMAKTEI